MLTLHEAIAVVLLKGSQNPAEIAAEINARQLYFRKDGGLVPVWQVVLRVRNYSHLFECIQDKIMLKNQKYEK